MNIPGAEESKISVNLEDRVVDDLGTPLAGMEDMYQDGVLTVTVPKSEIIPAKRSMTI